MARPLFLEVTPVDVIRFERYVDKRSEDECWPWTGGGNPRPAFWLRGRTIQATRVAFYVAYGSWPVYFVCHTCDNGWCMNPRHYFDGDASANAMDAVAKGRWALQNGPNNGIAKLTWEQVDEIRQLYGPLSVRGKGRSHAQVSMEELGNQYGVTTSQIHDLLHSKSYVRKEGDAK